MKASNANKVISVLLSVAMCPMMVPTAAFAADDGAASGASTAVEQAQPADQAEASGTGASSGNTLAAQPEAAEAATGEAAAGEAAGEAAAPAAVAQVGETAYTTLEDAFAALNSSNRALTLLDESAWDAAKPVYYKAGEVSGYVAKLTDALTAAYKANAGDITIVCRPGSDLGAMTHGHVADNITIYGNGAYISGGECDLEVDTYQYSRETGKQTNDAVTELAGKTITINAYDVDNLSVWGQRNTNATVNVNLTNCDGKAFGTTNPQRVYISGTSGMNNITLTDCDFITAATAVYSNADGAVAINNCSFTGSTVPVNFNHKASGAQTVTVSNSTFTNCGTTGDWAAFAAPARFVNSGTGALNATINGCSFAGTVGVNGDILIGDGRTGKESKEVTLTVTNTAANVQAQKPGYYGEGTTVVDASLKGEVATTAAKGLDGASIESIVTPAPAAVAKVDGTSYPSLQTAIDAAKDGSTVRLLADVALTETAVFPAGKTVHINLVGHNITATGTALRINGKTDIQSTGGTGTIESTGNVAVAVGDNAKVTVYSGTLKGREGAVITGTSTGATIEIRNNKATLIATDNAVIAGNGSNREGKPNTILVKGGTFIGGIESEGYIACGIYAPWNDNITVSGGTFNITNGAGIVTRAGTAKVTGGTFNCTGDGTGWVGDNKNQIPCAALVFDKAANYPALTDDSQILVSGGTFSTDPAANGATLADGYGATKNDDGMYKVAKLQPVAAIGDANYDTLGQAITAAQATAGGATIKLLKSIETSSYYEVKGDNPVTIDLNGFNITGSGISGLFYVTASGDLTITGEGTVTAVEENSAAMAVWVRSPKAKVTLAGGTYTQQISNTKDTHFDLIYVERGTAEITGGKYEAYTPEWTLNCKDEHYKSGEAKITVTGGTFNGFDPANNLAEGAGTVFTAPGVGITKNEDGSFTAAAGMTAQILDKDGNSVKACATLQAAIDAAQDGETVTLLADATEDVVINKNITLDLGGKTLTNTNAGKATISVQGGTVTVKNGNVLGGTSYYNIEVTKDSNANLTLTDVTATAGNADSSMIDNWGTLTIESGSYSGGLDVVKSEEDSTLTINGGKFELSHAVSGYTAVILAYGNTTITGGEFIQSLTTTGRWNHPQVVATGVVEGHTAITRVTGGHFVNKMSGEGIFRGVGKGTSDNFEVSGGTFNKSISEDFCADGFIPTKNADGTYGVKEVHYVAQVGSKKYETLADAIRLAAKGKTITLLTDVEQNSQLTIGKSITLDLNGKTIKNTQDIWGEKSNAILSITNGAKVTITGDGTIDAKENDCYTINVVKGDLTIENGTFYGNVSVVQVQEGTLSVKGGTFDLHQKMTDGKGENRYLINCIDSAYANGSANVAISGGTFVGFDPNVSPEQKVDGKAPSFAAPGVGITKNEDGSFTAAAGMTAQILDKDGNSVKACATLQAAIDAAQDGETVTLLADATEDVVINKNITLDLGGKTLTNTNAGKATISVQGGTVTVKNGNAVGGTGYYNIEVTKDSNANLTLADVTATAGNTGSSMIDNWGTLTITSGTYTGGLNTVKSEEGSKLGINDGKFVSDYAPRFGVTGTILVYGTTTIAGGEFIQNSTSTNARVVVTGKVDGYDSITYVNGGSFTNKGSGNIFHGVGKATSDNFEVSGGTFNKYVSDSYMADGYIPVKNSDGTYGVKEGKFVAEVGSVGYETFDEAIAAANASTNSKTIYLRENITVDHQLVIDNTKGKTITLDLEGFTLTSTYEINTAIKNGSYALVNNTPLTIKNGTFAAGQARALGALEALTLDGATVTQTLTGGHACVAFCANGKSYTIKNNSVIEGAYAVCNFANNSTINITGSKLIGTGNTLYHNGSNYGLKLTVKNTAITSSGSCGVYISGSTSAQSNAGNQNGAGGYQKATFTGCTISGAINGVEVKYTDLTLDSCTASTTAKDASYKQDNNGPAGSGFAVVSTDNAMNNVTPKPEGTIIIKGTGKYTGPVGLGSLKSVKETYADFADETINISDGTFTNEVPASYCAVGYAPVANADGTYGVKLAEGAYLLQDYRSGDQASWTYPTKEGMAFAGWYKDAAFTTACTESDVEGAAYAKFVKITDLLKFRGGSLRMDVAQPSELTWLRFGYTMALPEGASFVENGWYFKKVTTPQPTDVRRVANNNVLNIDGTITANLVFTGVTTNYYSATFSEKAFVKYVTADGTTVEAVESDYQVHSVLDVADVILAHPMASKAEKDYATQIKAAVSV